MRLFVAVYPPATALDHLAAALERLELGKATAAGAAVGLTARGLWHVTLAFLGEVPAERLPEVGAALESGVRRWQAAGEPPPRLRLAGAGRFGRGRFTVLWAGIEGDLAAFRRLEREVRRALRRARLPYDEDKPFRPHLTVARPRARLPSAAIRADLAALDSYRGPWWRADPVQLVRSRPGPTPEYQRVTLVPLTAPS